MLRTVTNSFASLSLLRDETKFARLKHVCLFNGPKNCSQNSLLIQGFWNENVNFYLSAPG